MNQSTAPSVAARGRSLSSVDSHIGTRIRLYRNALGLSQTALGRMVGVSYQQIQKYEHGDVRVSAAMLLALAQTLAVPLRGFFDGIAEGEAELTHSSELPDEQLMVRRETLELVRAYYRVGDATRRRTVFDLIQSLTPGSDAHPG